MLAELLDPPLEAYNFAEILSVPFWYKDHKDSQMAQWKRFDLYEYCMMLKSV